MWRRIFNLDCYRRSLRSSRFLSFPGRDRTRERKNGRAKKHAWREQNIGEKWRSGEREGREGGAEIFFQRNRLQSIPNVLPNSVRPRTGSNSAIWLVIGPSIKICHQKFSIRRGLRSFCSGNVERPFSIRQPHRSETGARSCHWRLVRRHIRCPCTLHLCM